MASGTVRKRTFQSLSGLNNPVTRVILSAPFTIDYWKLYELKRAMIVGGLRLCKANERLMSAYHQEQTFRSPPFSAVRSLNIQALQ